MNRFLATLVNRCCASVLGAALPVALAGSAEAQYPPVFRDLADFAYYFSADISRAPAIQGPDGTLYLTCSRGGANQHGCIASWANWTFTDLFDFDDTTTGSTPNGLVLSSDGTLFGTTVQGGSSNDGTIYKIKTDGTGFTVLADLDGTNSGGNPYDPLILASDGALYGTTSNGGYYGFGTAFKIGTDGSNFDVINSFDSTTNGANPEAGLVQASDGAFYVTTVNGGTNGDGTIDKLSLKTVHGKTFWACDVIANFDASTTGSNSYEALKEASDGMLYGMARGGGSAAYGTIFTLNKDGSGFASIHDFDGKNGAYPTTVFPLIEAANGTLYGVTTSGGTTYYPGGTAFQIDKDGSNFSLFYSFDAWGAGGVLPTGLTEGYDRDLYCTTASGGYNYTGGSLSRFLLYVAAWSNYGAGLAGTNGVPTFDSNMLPGLGTQFTMVIGNSRGATTNAVLLAGSSQASLPYKGGTLLVGQIFDVVPLSLPSPSLSLSVSIPSNPALSGYQFDLQALELDPGAVKGVSLTPGFEMTLGWW